MTTELLPCPFCGSPGVLEDDAAYARCSNGECEALSSLIGEGGADSWNRRASPWQPIETAPKDGTAIDLWAGRRIFDARWRCDSWVHADDPECYTWWAPEPEPFGCGVEWEEQRIGVEPTHWMHVPARPEA